MKTLARIICGCAVMCLATTACTEGGKEPNLDAPVEKYDLVWLDDTESYAWVRDQCGTDSDVNTDVNGHAYGDSTVYADGYRLSYRMGYAPMNEEYRYYNPDGRLVASYGAASETGYYCAWGYLYEDGRLARIVATAIGDDNDDEESDMMPQGRKSFDRFLAKAAELKGVDIAFRYGADEHLASVAIGDTIISAPEGGWLTAVPGKDRAFWASDIHGGMYELRIYDQAGNHVYTYSEQDEEVL